MSLFTSIATSKMVNDMLLGAVRTFMAGVIPAAIAGGWLPANAATGLLGSVMFLAALGLSVLDKIIRGQEHAEALATVPPGYVPAAVLPASAVSQAQAGPVTMKPIPNP